MFTVKTLLDESIDVIHESFVQAFSEYEVPIDMPVQKLAEMMRTRSYAPDLSLGCYAEGRLVGFLLAGYRNLGGIPTCYDVATGVVPDFQKQGLGDALLRTMLDRMESRGLDRFVLEVLANNKPAQRLYEKHGFKIARRLSCFSRQLSRNEAGDSGIPEPNRALSASTLGFDLSDQRLAFFAPSWQNSLESLRAAPEFYRTVVIGDGSEVSGFGIVHGKSGSILQIALAPSSRNLAALRSILSRLESLTESAKLTFLNVEAGCGLDRMLLEAGFESTVDQFEMVFNRTQNGRKPDSLPTS